MIDLHSHILFGLDDGASELGVSLEMARIAVADGITHMVCTPHVQDGVYPNTNQTIRPVFEQLKKALQERQIPLALFPGAEAHLAWDLPEKLLSGEIPTVNKTRYFLLELPHLIVPQGLCDFVTRLKNAGFIPIITHPERLAWTGRRADLLALINAIGCPLQVTADSLLGRFGAAALQQATLLLDTGSHVLVASDAHSPRSRAPRLATAMEMVASRWGEAAARRMFIDTPQMILADEMLPDFRRADMARRRFVPPGNRVDRLFNFLRAGH